LQYLNPHLSEFPNYVASGGISSAKSPDGKTLLVLTAGRPDQSVDQSAHLLDQVQICRKIIPSER